MLLFRSFFLSVNTNLFESELPNRVGETTGYNHRPGERQTQANLWGTARRALLLGYNVSLLQVAMGYCTWCICGASTAQRVTVAYLTSCVRVHNQHCTDWRAFWMLPHPPGNFPWSDHASTTLHQVEGAWAGYLNNRIALVACVVSI